MEYNEEVHSNLTTYNIEKSDWGGMNALISGSSLMMLSSMDDKMSASMIRSSIDAELLRDQVSELQYKLVDRITHSTNKIENAIQSVGKELVHELKSIDTSLKTSIIQLEIVNRTLDTMSNQLQTLIEKVSTPNETEALELSNQARINLALEKNELALDITKKALDISGGTSITVLAFRILTLSLVEDEASKKEILLRYKNFVNLIDFKLKDTQSKSSTVHEEVNNTVYTVMAVMGYRYEHTVLELTQKLYRALVREKETAFILAKPLKDEATLKLISYSNFLRELHWTILVKEYVLKSANIQACLNCLDALESGEVLVKNELLLILGKYFVEERLFYTFMVDSLAGHQSDENEKTNNSFLSSLPHKVIKLDKYDLALLSWYGREKKPKISSEFKQNLQKFKNEQKEDIQQNYLKYYEEKENALRSQEFISNSMIEKEKEKLKEIEEHNKKINEYEYSKKIWKLKSGAKRLGDKLSIPAFIVAIAIFTFFYHWSDESSFLFNSFYFVVFIMVLFMGVGLIIRLPKVFQEKKIKQYQKLLAKKETTSPQREHIKEVAQKEFEKFLELEKLVESEQDALKDYYVSLLSNYAVGVNPLCERQLGESVETLNQFVAFNLMKEEMQGKEYFNFNLSEQYLTEIDKVKLGVNVLNTYNSDYVEVTKSKEYQALLGCKYRSQINYLLYTLTIKGLVAEGVKVYVGSYSPSKSLRLIKEGRMVLEEKLRNKV